MKKNQSLLSRFNMTFIESYKIELEDLRKLTIYIPKRIPRFYEKYKGKEDRLIYALNTLKKESTSCTSSIKSISVCGSLICFQLNFGIGTTSSPSLSTRSASRITGVTVFKNLLSSS